MRPVVVAALLAALLSGLVLIRVCADGGAMGAAYRTCDCRGYEWQVYDRTPADGPRRTLCFGVMRSRTCHQFRDGPEIPCHGDSVAAESVSRNSEPVGPE